MTGREVHVKLIPTVERQMERLQERTGLSDADAVNRALTVYEYIDTLMSEGHDILVRHAQTKEIQAMRVL